MANKNKQKKSGTPTPASSAPDTEIDSNERRRILSAILLERLQKQDVVWVRIADPDVLRVDDLQIATKTRIDAYLIRWSEWADTLVLEDLTADQSGTGSLIRQLADGWTRLKKEYRLPITVHLLTNDQPSAKKFKDAQKSDCHLAKFLAHEWKRNQRDNDDWSMIWDEIRTASGLSESRFNEFVEACKFDCSYARPELDEDADEYQPYYWVEHIYDTLFEHEDHSTLPIELNHAELLQLLGWRREQSRQILKLPKADAASIPGAVLQSVDVAPAFNGTAGGDAPSDHTQNETFEELPNGIDSVNEEQTLFQERAGSAKPQPSLSSLRGASAAWLQAASDSESETADWLKAGAPPAGTTASGGTFFGSPPANISPGSGILDSPSSAESGDLSGDFPTRSSLSTSLTGKKQSKEKPSWKDLAEKNRDAPGPRKFGEPSESKSDNIESQRITGKLRQMMSSIKTEAPEETDEDNEDFEDSRAEIGREDNDFDADENKELEESEQSEFSSQERNQVSVPDQSEPADLEPGDIDAKDQSDGSDQDQSEVSHQFPNTNSESGVLAQNKSARDEQRKFLADSEHEDAEPMDASGSVKSDDTVTKGRSSFKKTKSRRSKSRWQKREENELESSAEDQETSQDETADTGNEGDENDRGSRKGSQAEELGDTFARISRLARKQEGTDAGDLEANLDAFRWYISNGDELFQESRFEDAEREYIRALELLGSLDVPTNDEEFKILQNLGDIYLFLDYPDKAVELYECTKEDRFTSKVPASKYIAALIKLGAVYEERNCFNDAERQYRKAVEVAAEHLEKDDPILVRLNQACLDLARNRSTLMSRFSSTEVERIRVLAQQEAEVAIMHRKKKTTEAELVQPELWRGGIRPQTEELVAGPPPSSRQRWMIASAAIAIIFIFAFASSVPHGVVPDAGSGATDESIGTYSSTDGLKVIDLGPSGRAHYSFKGNSKDAKYSFIGDTIQDLIPFIPGHLRTAFLFFNSKDDAIIDANGTHFYQENAPEHRLVKQMWKYATLAQGYRLEKNFYPETDDAWTISKEKLTFLNPVTKTEDQAVIFSTMSEATDTPIRKQIAEGELWKGQPAPGPGRITCNVFNSRMFFIRGYDRNGKVLTSSDPKHCFYIECSDGLDITKEDLAKPQDDKKGTDEANNPAQNSDKKLRFIFAANPETEARFTFLLSAVPGALFCLMVVTLAIWRYRVNRKTAGIFSVAAFALSTLLLLAWFVVGILQV